MLSSYAVVYGYILCLLYGLNPAMEWQSPDQPDSQHPVFDGRVRQHVLDLLGELGVEGEGHAI